MKFDGRALARIGMWLLLIGLGLGLLAAHDWNPGKVLAALPRDPRWFTIAMSLLPLAGFPIAVCYLYAGASFGFLAGWGCCLLALAINLVLSYLLGAHLLQTPIRRLLEKRGHELPDLSDLNQLRFTFLLRTVPGPPFPVQNYLLSAIGVRFGVYWPVSWLTQGALAAGMVSIGHYTALPRARVYVLVALGLLGLLVLLRSWIRRRSKA